MLSRRSALVCQRLPFKTAAARHDSQYEDAATRRRHASHEFNVVQASVEPRQPLLRQPADAPA